MTRAPGRPFSIGRLLWLVLVALLLIVAGWFKFNRETQSGLVFERFEVFQDVKISQSEVIARFPFRNRGRQPIRILEVKSDCSCTTASLGKDTFAPGERGEILVTFNVGVRTGMQRKGVVLSTDAPEQRLVALSLVASIPEVITLPTSVLLWQANEQADPKSLVVKTSQAPLVTQLTAVTDSPFLKVAVERMTATEFRVEVTPTLSRRDITAALQLDAVLEGGLRKRVSAFVRVR